MSERKKREYDELPMHFVPHRERCGRDGWQYAVLVDDYCCGTCGRKLWLVPRLEPGETRTLRATCCDVNWTMFVAHPDALNARVRR